MTEADLLTQCKHLLRFAANRHGFHWRRVHTVAIPRGNFKTGTGRFSKNLDMAGMPDIMVWLSGARILHLELKSKNGILSEEQKAFQVEMLRLGHIYRVIRKIEDLEEVLAEEGLPFGSVVAV